MHKKTYMTGSRRWHELEGLRGALSGVKVVFRVQDCASHYVSMQLVACLEREHSSRLLSSKFVCLFVLTCSTVAQAGFELAV